MPGHTESMATWSQSKSMFLPTLLLGFGSSGSRQNNKDHDWSDPSMSGKGFTSSLMPGVKVCSAFPYFQVDLLFFDRPSHFLLLLHLHSFHCIIVISSLKTVLPHFNFSVLQSSKVSRVNESYVWWWCKERTRQRRGRQQELKFIL